MSMWTHAICFDCWDKREPTTEAIPIFITEFETCCFCGHETQAGIYVREDPCKVRCKGQGVVHG